MYYSNQLFSVQQIHSQPPYEAVIMNTLGAVYQLAPNSSVLLLAAPNFAVPDGAGLSS